MIFKYCNKADKLEIQGQGHNAVVTNIYRVRLNDK